MNQHTLYNALALFLSLFFIVLFLFSVFFFLVSRCHLARVCVLQWWWRAASGKMIEKEGERERGEGRGNARLAHARIARAKNIISRKCKY